MDIEKNAVSAPAQCLTCRVEGRKRDELAGPTQAHRDEKRSGEINHSRKKRGVVHSMGWLASREENYTGCSGIHTRLSIGCAKLPKVRGTRTDQRGSSQT